ncbi:MAG: hypothetical protein WB763_05080 [Terriglobia bacterium]
MTPWRLQALQTAFSSTCLDVPPMGIATCFTATPRAHADLLKMFEVPVPILRLLLSWDERRIISQPGLHLHIERVEVYFRSVLTTELLQ